MAAYLGKAAQSPFLNHVGFKIVETAADDLILKLTIQTEHHNINHTLHGGVHAAMLESIQSLAIQTIYQAKSSVMNLNIHYLAPVFTGEIFASARIIQKGYKVAAVESKIVDIEQKLIAKGSGVYQILRD